MPKTISRWKLTFDPGGAAVVLVDFGQKLDDDLRFPLRKGVEEVRLVRAAAPLLRNTGNHAVGIRIGVYQDESTDKAARAAVLTSLIAAAGYGVKPLRVEIDDHAAGYWQFASCAVTEHEPARHIEAPAARWLRVYQLTCAGLSYTAI